MEYKHIKIAKYKYDDIVSIGSKLNEMYKMISSLSIQDVFKQSLLDDILGIKKVVKDKATVYNEKRRIGEKADRGTAQVQRRGATPEVHSEVNE